MWELDLGATIVSPTSVRFRVWAPKANTVAVRILNHTGNDIPLQQHPGGYWETVVEALNPGVKYFYVLNGKTERPDPASRSQPDSVHDASQIIDPENFQWTDRNWKGLPLNQFIIYEVHTGTFTPEGTFEAMIPRLPYLAEELGITALELMPVAQCPGTRNWGYDGTYLFAPQTNYGGPDGLKRLIDAAHQHGLAVVIDVVYNHLGPEGNYLGDFGPYFTHRYPTPWGEAINYDGPESDAIRHFIISNAVHWIREYHVDALRLDAIHGIFDFSAKHILQEIGEIIRAEEHRLGRKVSLIAESDLNDSRIISPIGKGGYGLDGQWNDDFHHALHTVLTGEDKGYYADFGKLTQLATAIQNHFVYTGEYSQHRRRRHGNSAKSCLPSQFVVYSQNHDQIGNRAKGDRLSTLVTFEAIKVAAGMVLLSPSIPLLFMGEEYGETAPFLYFIDHGDTALIEAVRQGRLAEFRSFGWKDVPDPYEIETFTKSRLQPKLDEDPQQRGLFQWYKQLLTLRKTIPALGVTQKQSQVKIQTFRTSKALAVVRTAQSGPSALILYGLNSDPTTLRLTKPLGKWHKRLDSHTSEFASTETILSPSTLDITPNGLTINLPSYSAVIYTQET